MKEPVGVIPKLSRVLQYRPVAFKFCYNLLYKISSNYMGLSFWQRTFATTIISRKYNTS